MTFHKLYEWLTLRDVTKALVDAQVDVIKRYSRGNVSVQNGGILDEEGLDEVRRLGDSAVEDLTIQQKKYFPNVGAARVR